MILDDKRTNLTLKKNWEVSKILFPINFLTILPVDFITEFSCKK